MRQDYKQALRNYIYNALPFFIETNMNPLTDEEKNMRDVLKYFYEKLKEKV